MKKRLLLALSLLACLAVGFAGVLWLTAPRQRITPESFAKINQGMTLQEVEYILGGPPGDYGPGWDLLMYLQRDESEMWSEGNCLICVYLEGGRVRSASLSESLRVEEPFLDKLRRWLGI